MAKAKKAAGADSAESQAPARQVITQSKLRSLMASHRRAKNDIAEITGSLGQEIKYAEENNHLNRKVFKLITTLDKMEPEALATWHEDFEHYFDISGLRARMESAPRMAFEDDKTGDAGEAPAEEGADNVHALHA